MFNNFAYSRSSLTWFNSPCWENARGENLSFQVPGKKSTYVKVFTNNKKWGSSKKQNEYITHNIQIYYFILWECFPSIKGKLSCDITLLTASAPPNWNLASQCLSCLLPLLVSQVEMSGEGNERAKATWYGHELLHSYVGCPENTVIPGSFLPPTNIEVLGTPVCN